MDMISQVVADFGLHFEAESIPSEPTMQNVKFNLEFLESNQEFVVSTTDSITNLGSKIWLIFLNLRIRNSIWTLNFQIFDPIWTKFFADAFEAAVDYVVDLKKGRQTRNCRTAIIVQGLYRLYRALSWADWTDKRIYCTRLVERSGLMDLLIADENGVEVELDDSSYWFQINTKWLTYKLTQNWNLTLALLWDVITVKYPSKATRVQLAILCHYWTQAALLIYKTTVKYHQQLLPEYAEQSMNSVTI